MDEVNKKLVFVCSSLRGDIKSNIEAAKRQFRRNVEGNPSCKH